MKQRLSNRYILGLYIISAGMAALLFLSTGPRPALATSLIVTTEQDASGGPQCTLRDAIQAANTDSAAGACPAGSGPDTISFAGNVNNIRLASALPTITSDITLAGPGQPNLNINANAPNFRLFTLSGSAANLTLKNLTVSKGLVNFTPGQPGKGGCILNQGGRLDLQGVSLESCRAEFGGAIYNEPGSLLFLTNSQLKTNLAQGGNGTAGTYTSSTAAGIGGGGGGAGIGGAIYSTQSQVVISGTTFTQNMAQGGNGGSGYSGGGGGAGIGGAVFNLETSLTITNSTFLTNKALGGNAGNIYQASSSNGAGGGSGGGASPGGNGNFGGGGSGGGTTTVQNGTNGGLGGFGGGGGGTGNDSAHIGVGAPGAGGFGGGNGGSGNPVGVGGGTGASGGSGLGGTIYSIDSQITLTGMTFTTNEAAGGTPGNTPPIDKNGAPGSQAWGGGLYLNNGSLTLVGSAFSGNKVTGGNGGNATDYLGLGGQGGTASGGAVVLYGVSASVTGGSFDSNIALGGIGGAKGSQASIGGIGGTVNGGALYTNGGTLTISGTPFTNNQASGGGGANYGPGGTANGGAIYLETGTVKYSGAALNGNQAKGGTSAVNGSEGNTGGTGRGGAIAAPGGTMEISASLLSNNQALGGSSNPTTAVGSGGPGGLGQGGGVYGEGGSLAFINTTISGNLAKGGNGGNGQNSGGAGGTGQGGAVALNGGNAALASATLGNNQAAAGTAGLKISGSIPGPAGSAQGGGFYVAATNPTVSLKNSLVATNVAATAGPDIFGQVTSQDYNLVGNTGGATITGLTANNITNQNALLGPLQNNGGPTFTQNLLGSSPAINAGNPAGCTDLATPAPQPLTTDQRGMARVVRGRCDIGALEVEPPTFTVNSIADSPDATVGDRICGVAQTGLCTLRAAIQEVKAFGGEGNIVFNLSNPATIPINTALPDLAGNISVTAACGANGASVTLVGNSGVSGIHLAGGVRWYGVAVQGFDGPQIRLDTSQTASKNTVGCTRAG